MGDNREADWFVLLVMAVNRIPNFSRPAWTYIDKSQ